MSEVLSGSLTLRFASCHDEIGEEGFHSSTAARGSAFLLKRFLVAQDPLLSSPAPSKETTEESLGFQIKPMPCRPHRILNTHSPYGGSLHPQTHWNCSVFKILPDKSSPFALGSTKVPFKDPSGELCFYSLSVLLSPILGQLLEPRLPLHLGLVPCPYP